MLTLTQAQAAIQERITPAAKVEWVSLRQALGRYAAEAVQARVDNPAFDNSAMDGYACPFRVRRCEGSACVARNTAGMTRPITATTSREMLNPARATLNRCTL